MPKLIDKKILIIIAFSDFQDYEYGKTREILESQGAEIILASSNRGEAVGKFGTKVKIDFSLDNVKTEDFEAIIFVGGPGAIGYQDDLQAHRIIQEAVAQNKILAAICIAPLILAQAGALKGKKATVWSSSTDRAPIEELEQTGAIFVAQDVARDGKIITANGPKATETFARTILEALLES